MTTYSASPDLDVTTPASSRVYDVWLGGKDNFAPDRACADSLNAAVPSLPDAARKNRNFLIRAVQYLVADCGIRQILDIGCGLPAGDNVHEVAQKINPACRVVYVDNDNLVASHARALMTNSTPEGKAAFIPGDLREPDMLLRDDTLRSTLNLNEPVALLLVGVLPFCDPNTATPAVKTLTTSLPTGSYVALTHLAEDPLDAPTRELLARVRDQVGLHPFEFGSIAEVDSLLADLIAVEPGLVPASLWQPELGPKLDPTGVEEILYAAVARVP